MEECINLLIGDDGVARPAVPVTVYVEDETQAENLMQFLMNNHEAVTAAISGERRKPVNKSSNRLSMSLNISFETNLTSLSEAIDEVYTRIEAVGIKIIDSANEEMYSMEDGHEIFDPDDDDDEDDDDTPDIHEENVDPDWCKVPNEAAPNQYKSNPSTKYPNASFVYNPDVIKEATEHAEEILGGHTFSKENPWYFPVYLKVFVRDEEACIRNHSYGLCDVLEFEALENLRTDLKKLSTSELQATIIDRLSDVMRKSRYGFNPENFTCGVFLWGRS